MRDALRHHQLGVLIHQRDLFRLEGIVVHQIVAQPRPAVVVRKREHHVLPLQLELLLQLREHAVAHPLRDAFEVAGDQDGAASLGVFEGQRLHPQLVQFAVRRPFGPIAGEPHGFFRRDDRLGDTGPPVRRFGLNVARQDSPGDGQDAQTPSTGPVCKDAWGCVCALHGLALSLRVSPESGLASLSRVFDPLGSRRLYSNGKSHGRRSVRSCPSSAARQTDSGSVPQPTGRGQSAGQGVQTLALTEKK